MSKSKQNENQFEKVIYEIRPYLLTMISLYAVINKTSPLMLFSGVVLLLASTYILRCRLQHRGILR